MRFDSICAGFESGVPADPVPLAAATGGRNSRQEKEREEGKINVDREIRIGYVAS